MATVRTEIGYWHETLIDGMPVFGIIAMNIDANDPERQHDPEQVALIEETVARVSGKIAVVEVLPDLDN